MFSKNFLKDLFFPLLILTKNSVVIAALSYVLTIMLANQFGPAEFGIYSQALIYASLFSIIINFGTEQTASADIAAHNNSVETLSCFTWLRLVMFGASSIAAYLILSEDGFLLYFVFVLALTNFNLSFYYEIRKENSRYSYIYLIERIVYISGAFALIGFDMLSLEYIFMLYAAATIASLLFQFQDSRVLTSIIVKGLFRRIIFLIQQNLPLVITGLAVFTLGGISRLVMDSNLGTEALGIYSAGWQMVTIASIYQAQVVRVWRLKISKAIQEKNASEFFDCVKTYLILGVVPMCLIAVFFWLSSDWIVRFIFTEEYAPLATLLPTFGLLVVVISMNGLVEICWIATGKTQIYMVTAIFYGLLMLVMLYFFSDGYGILEFAKLTTGVHTALMITLFVFWYQRVYPSLIRKT